jgi:predicted DCC family thiol-disulfide oxidoreductase YuxK
MFEGSAAAAPVALIYDDQCGLCRGFVGWVRARDRAGSFEFVPCRSDQLPVRFPQVPREACERAMQLVRRDGAVLAGADAVPEVLRRIPGWSLPARLLAWRALRPINRRVYRWIADNRPRDGAAASCELRR